MILRTSCEVNRNGWGVCERALQLHPSWKGLAGIAKAKTGIGKSDLPGLQGGPRERGHDSYDMVRAPRFYPDPEKTKIVYCKDDLRRGTYPNEKFDFLGYTFRPRRSKNRKGKFFINFSPAVSNQATKAIRDEFRRWKLPKRSDKAIEDLSRMFNPIIRGWLQYYGRYYRSALYPTMRELDRDLALWAKRKYKKLRHHLRRATRWIARISRRNPGLFAHWKMGTRRGSMMGAV